MFRRGGIERLTLRDFPRRGWTMDRQWPPRTESTRFFSSCFPSRKQKLKKPNATITSYFGFFGLRKTRSGKSYDYHDTIVFKNLPFKTISRPHKNEKPLFSNCSALKSVFEKLRVSLTDWAKVDGRPSRIGK